MPTVVINGRRVVVPSSAEEAHIRQAGQIANDRALIVRRREGNFVITRGSRVTPADGDVFTDAPRRIKGNRHNERIQRELQMIAPRFAHSGGVMCDDENWDWLIIPNYPLPERWKTRTGKVLWCKLLIVFPETYPETPPIGFYLNRKFWLNDGSRDSHLTGQSYDGAPDLREAGWYWYCVRVEGGAWKPQADYMKPDNLWTFLNMVRESLTNDF